MNFKVKERSVLQNSWTVGTTNENKGFKIFNSNPDINQFSPDIQVPLNTSCHRKTTNSDSVCGAAEDLDCKLGHRKSVRWDSMSH